MIPVKINVIGHNLQEENFNSLMRKYPYFIKLKSGESEFVEEIEVSVPSSFKKADELLWDSLMKEFPGTSISRIRKSDDTDHFLVSLSESHDMVGDVEKIIGTQVQTALSWGSYDSLAFLASCLSQEGRKMSEKEVFFSEEMIARIDNSEVRFSLAKRNRKVVEVFYNPVIEGRPLNEGEAENLQTALDKVRRDSEIETAISSAIALVLIAAFIAAVVCFVVFNLHHLVVLGLMIFLFIAGGVGTYAWITGGESKISLGICDKIERRRRS